MTGAKPVIAITKDQYGIKYRNYNYKKVSVHNQLLQLQLQKDQYVINYCNPSLMYLALNDVDMPQYPLSVSIL